jgi:type IV fimbrial biogenesis protein FimT
MLKSMRRRGVTLIELLITVAVVSIALSLAAPSMSTQIANYRVRSATDSILGGLSLARTEAVRRNSAVRFTLNAGSSAWTVAQVSPSTTIQSRAAAENAGVTTTSGNTAWSVTFNPTGMVDTSSAWLGHITVSSSARHTDSRQIDIMGGGLVRSCDPAATGSNDPRRC